ncbi:MAG: hypothetical protein ACLFR2_02795 [Candidatus Kapaibacterium sp.]
MKFIVLLLSNIAGYVAGLFVAMLIWGWVEISYNLWDTHIIVFSVILTGSLTQTIILQKKINKEHRDHAAVQFTKFNLFYSFLLAILVEMLDVHVFN